MYKLFPLPPGRDAAPPPSLATTGRSMDAAGTAAALGCVATELTAQIKAFRARMRTKPSLLNTLIRLCSVVEGDASLIVEELQGSDPAELAADGSWRMLGLRLWEMKEQLEDFSRQLGGLHHHHGGEATTELGRAMLAMRSETDDVLPEIKQIQEEIDWRYRSLQVWIPFALQTHSQRKTSITSVASAPLPPPLQVLTPPLTPDDRSIHTVHTTSGHSHGHSRGRRPSEASSINLSQPSSYGHARRQSEASASTITDDSESPAVQIVRAARRTDVRAVKQLLEDDTTGALAATVDASGRTLIDIVLCSGKRTSKAQVPMVKLLREWGAKFTLTKHKAEYNAYKDIVNTIKFQAGSKR